MQKPIIPLTLAFIVGLLLGHGFLYFPCSIGIIVTLSILTTGLLTTLHKLPLRSFLLMVIPGIIGVILYVYSAAWFPSDHYTRAFTPDNKLHEITGTIASPLDRDPGRTAFSMDVRDIDGMQVTGAVRVSVREETTQLGYGDTIRVFGKIFEPKGFNNPNGFDYPAYLAQNNIYYTVSVKDSSKVLVLHPGKGIFRTIQDWRERIRQSFLASTTGPGSAILQAMVIGEEGRLTEEMRDQFMAAGVTHIISISGSHLGMVAVLCFGLLRGLLFLMPERLYHQLTLSVDPKKIAAWLTLPLVIFYTLLAGGQVATIRSLLMISAGLLAIILDRENALMHSLAIAALLILMVSPQAIFDISFQLSYLSVLVIGYVVALWNNLELKAHNALHKFRNSAILLFIISLATSLATGPLVAHYFNQFSFAGIISNTIVVPFAGMVVVPLGLFSAILSLFLGHLPFAGINQLVCDIFVYVVAFFSRLPFAEFHPPAPGVLWLLFYALFLLSLGAFISARLLAWFKPFERSSRIAKLPLVGMALSGTVLVLSLAFFLAPNKRAQISFIDVGQGDCELIRLRSGKTILIDGGGAYDNRFDIGRRVVAPYLWNKGIHTIDLVILSHPHPDHMNGLKFIFKKFNVAQVWESERDPDLPGYADFRRIIAEKNIARKTVSAEDAPVVLGEAELRVLHPSRTFTSHDQKAYMAENNRALVVRIAFNNKVGLFTGDIGAEAEQRLIQTSRDIKCDLLKVPHHGSNTSSSNVFLSKTRPEIAVVTCGRGNPYGHPSDEVLARYAHIGTRVRRTDLDGAITIVVKPGRLDSLQWNDRILTRICLTDRANWGKTERMNWSKLLFRETAL
jgi:competence protein ComEC